MKTLENRILELERQHGTGCRLELRANGETDEEAIQRLGLADWPGQIIFFIESDAKL